MAQKEKVDLQRAYNAASLGLFEGLEEIRRKSAQKFSFEIEERNYFTCDTIMFPSTPFRGLCIKTNIQAVKIEDTGSGSVDIHVIPADLGRTRIRAVGDAYKTCDFNFGPMTTVESATAFRKKKATKKVLGFVEQKAKQAKLVP